MVVRLQVCGGSYLNLGGCQATDVKWWQARVFCERSGARLCTSKELLEDETRSTGYGTFATIYQLSVAMFKLSTLLCLLVHTSFMLSPWHKI